MQMNSYRKEFMYNNPILETVILLEPIIDQRNMVG